MGDTNLGQQARKLGVSGHGLSAVRTFCAIIGLMVLTAKPIGIIDALASGFTVLHRRIGLVLIPILVSVVLGRVKLTVAAAEHLDERWG
jgi:hypothetical protein